MKNYLLILLAAIALSSCKKREPIVFTNDSEQSFGWINQRTFKDDPNAHSGGHVSSTDSVQQYSITLREKIANVRKQGATKVLVSTWVKFSDPSAKACLVVSFDHNGKNLGWQCMPAESVIKEAGKWIELTYTMKFPAGLPDDATVSVFVWNTSKVEVQVDDMEVRFEK